MKYRRLKALAPSMTLSLVILLFCASGLAQEPTPALAIENVTVLPMTEDGAVLKNMTVIVRHGRIESITQSATTTIPKDAQRIDGIGKWLMPGLTDMHVHIENARMLRLYLHAPAPADGTVQTQDTLIPYIANGALQIVDLSAMPETIGQSIEVESGRALGPHIITAFMIDGADPFLPAGISHVAATPSDGRQAVRDAAADGYQLIKVYGKLDLDTFTAIVDEARRMKMRVVGHIPQRGKGMTQEFFQPGYDMVAHGEEFFWQTNSPSDTDIPRYVEMMKRNHTWLTSTLTTDERILEETSHPESLKARPDLRFITPFLYPFVLNHNRYVAQASPQRIAQLEHLLDFNRKLYGLSLRQESQLLPEPTLQFRVSCPVSLCLMNWRRWEAPD